MKPLVLHAPQHPMRAAMERKSHGELTAAWLPAPTPSPCHLSTSAAARCGPRVCGTASARGARPGGQLVAPGARSLLPPVPRGRRCCPPASAPPLTARARACRSRASSACSRSWARCWRLRCWARSRARGTWARSVCCWAWCWSSATSTTCRRAPMGVGLGLTLSTAGAVAGRRQQVRPTGMRRRAAPGPAAPDCSQERGRQHGFGSRTCRRMPHSRALAGRGVRSQAQWLELAGSRVAGMLAGCSSEPGPARPRAPTGWAPNKRPMPAQAAQARLCLSRRVRR